MDASARNSESPNSVASPLSLAKPTPTLRTALLKIARDSNTDTQKVAEAYDTLFMLALDDAEVRKEVRDKIKWRNESSTRAGLASDLLVRGSSRWGLSELEDLYRHFLSIPYKLENYPARSGRPELQYQYDISIRGLKAFGKLGASFADLLKARLAEMDPAEDADLINSCKETILMVEGKCNPKPVVSWKGAFLGVSSKSYPAWLADHKTSSPAPAPRRKRHPYKARHPKPPAIQDRFSAEPIYAKTDKGNLKSVGVDDITGMKAVINCDHLARTSALRSRQLRSGCWP